jgi:regulator of PEP synthase PpsR (kinase-PPPase family)
MLNSTENKQLKIIIISDGTGETASGLVRAALTQFPDQDVYFTRYKNVRSQKQLDAIFDQAAIGHDLIVYTLVSQELRLQIQELSRAKMVRAVDLMGDLLTQFSNLFQSHPSHLPGLLHAVDDNYFKRVAAMEFTLNHDDGQNLQTLHLADVILVGISRTSKTPLSIYLSLHGLKVVNVPLIMNTPIGEGIFKVDQRKIFALTIDPKALWEIRRNRLTGLGAQSHQGEYADVAKINEEVKWALKIFAENKRWPVLDVTNKAVEETASEILKLLQMRQNNIFKQNKRFTPNPT